MSINSTKDELKSIEQRLTQCEHSLTEKSDVLSKLDYYYDQFTSWADEFDTATTEQKKMIICQLIKEIRVYKDYNIEIALLTQSLFLYTASKLFAFFNGLRTFCKN